MDTWTLPVFLRVVKGAPLACLLALRWLRRPAGVLEISEITGIERTTVRRALRTLAADGIRLAESPGGYGQWRLTAVAVQLPLFTPDQLAAGSDLEEKNLQFHSSSSSLINHSLEEVKVKPLLLLRGDLEEKNLQFAPEVVRLAEILVTRTGCNRIRAQAAVQMALDGHGLTPAAVEIEIITWLHYCQQRKGKGIDNPGAFIAAKLSRNEPAPENMDLGNYSEDYWRVQALRSQESGDRDQDAEGEDT